jgi:hypothetical protein
LRLCSVRSDADPCASSDTRFSGSAPIKARSSISTISWDEQFSKHRKISDRRSYVEWKKRYNSYGDDLELFFQDAEDTTGRFEVEELKKFCHGVALSDVKNGVGAAGKDRIVWLDDRTSGGKLDPKDRGQEGKIANPLTAQELQGTLAEPRFDHKKKPDAARRLVYISDLSPGCIHALAGTASSYQTPVLRKAIHKYLSFQTSIGFKTSLSGFPIFQLDLHLPFFRLKLETPPEKPLGHRNLIMTPQRRWTDLSFLEFPDGNSEGRDQGPEEMGAWGLHEAQISCVVAGSDGLRWLAYGFVDAEIEADLPNDRMRHFRCPDEDNMSSVSSNDQESLFDYSPSESGTTITVGSSAVQQELTYTNIEHMLAVLKAERRKCLGELRGFDAALETIDQLANRKRPGLEICFNRVRVNDVSLP